MEPLPPPRTTDVSSSAAFTLRVRDVLLQHGVTPAIADPIDSLRQRLYRAVATLVPPSRTTKRSSSSPAHHTDEALLADFLRGDHSAFESLMDRHLGWAQGWASKHLPPEEAKDAVQEAFTDLLKKAKDLPSQVVFKPWLFGFLRVSVLRARRSFSRRQGLLFEGESLDAVVDTREDPETSLLTQHSHEELAHALESSCSLAEQEVILFSLEGQDDRTIASALGLTANHVRVLRHRAMTKLRRALASDAPQPAPPGPAHGR